MIGEKIKVFKQGNPFIETLFQEGGSVMIDQGEMSLFICLFCHSRIGELKLICRFKRKSH